MYNPFKRPVGFIPNTSHLLKKRRVKSKGKP